MVKSRQTRQKELISAEIEKFKEFFTAEELYSKLKNKDSSIGLATVYRFMSDLRKKNEIHHYTCDGKMLYSLNKKSHCHFICEETGQVIHFDVESLDFLKHKFPGSISSFQIEVKGVCNDCIKKK